MALSKRKLVSGGLLAGLVIILANLIGQFAIMERVRSEMNAWIPGAAERIGAEAAPIVAGIVMKFVIGCALVWIYAAIRPCYGPGLKTAAYAGVFAWILGAIFMSDYLMMGMMSGATYVMVELIQLVGFVVASWLGARVYENGLAAPARTQ